MTKRAWPEPRAIAMRSQALKPSCTLTCPCCGSAIVFGVYNSSNQMHMQARNTVSIQCVVVFYADPCHDISILCMMLKDPKHEPCRSIGP